MELISMKIHDLPIPAVNCVLSFRPYLKYVEEQMLTTNSEVYKNFLKSIASLIKASPELLEPITDFGLLDKHKELVELVKITHLSQVKSDGNMYTLGIPSGKPPVINYFGYSDEFIDFFKTNSHHLKLTSLGIGEEFRRNTYREILKKAYKIDNYDAEPEAMLQWSYEVNGVTHYYKVIKRHQFVDIQVEGGIPELQQEWLDYACGNIASYTEIKEPLPFEKFILEGFFIFSVVPETKEVALDELNKTISELHTNSSDQTVFNLKRATLSLLGSDNIELGFLAALKVNGEYVYHDFYSTISIVFGRLKRHFTQDELAMMYHCIAEHSAESSNAISSLNNDIYEMEEETGAIQHVKDVLSKEGLTALKFIPVMHNDTLLGIIELGSKDEKEINIDILRKLDKAMPVFREFFLYKTVAFNDYMKSFIMQRYTSIQESVAWRFNEEVWNAMKNLSSPSQLPSTPPVRFEDLYPFYGAVDFRNSSLRQLEAIHADYHSQLQYLATLFPNDIIGTSDKSLNDFLIKVQYWINHLAGDLDIQDESSLRLFLETESVNFLASQAHHGKMDSSIATEYEKTIASKYGRFHAFHNKYEESIQDLNRILKEQLLKAEVSLQNKLPHYFEKFQTDGIEYSLYAGKEIDPSRNFPSNGLEILVDWQLNVMLKMAIAANAYKENLSVPLETTQLILVHENTVDISYRIDEHHFDVEGSYSIRYQVLKKRIDKVRLLNSTERLTQPGTISIVYANKNSISLYLEKIKELISQNKLSMDIEYLDLEQLQTIGKLKAIRVKINIENKALLSEEVGDVLVVNE
ncbi:MAG: hypothetical protein HOP08_12630 [Cyclobacteriaceae bacterium]|nr:hypothetical protein [Cyclobacteriaceae bacterium]